MKKIAIILLAAVLTTACGGKKNKNTETGDTAAVPTEEAIADAHNALNSLDYVGTYLGNLPCADCEGIRTEITIGEDTYTMTQEYLGKKKDNIVKSGGEYTWNEMGDTIILLGETAPNKYKVGENILIKLDMEGKTVEGALADKYILRKI